jgi:tetratricopeptide (TPR) repeat protein
MVIRPDGLPPWNRWRRPLPRSLLPAAAAMFLGVSAGAAILADAHPGWIGPLLLVVVLLTGVATLVLPPESRTVSPPSRSTVVAPARWGRPRPRRLPPAAAAMFLGLAAGAGILASAQPRWIGPLLVAAVLLTALGTYSLTPRARIPSLPLAPIAPDAARPPPSPEPTVLPGSTSEPVPRLLPVRQETFKGRVAELAELQRRHDLGRRRRESLAYPAGDGSAEDSAAAGALLILLHGRPGVGKTALALELAHRLAPGYPGGHLYANLGSAGNQRPPGDVLKDFLEALGWNRRMPQSTEDRANSFRSLLADRKRPVLVVLEAARDADQVLQLMPTNRESTVIVTSRRDLGPALSARAPSFLVDVPSASDAAEILRTAAQTSPYEQPVCTARVVELCARLPLALRSAGEQAAELPGKLCEIDEALQPEQTRLARLPFRGRDVRRRFEVEYHRLTDRVQEAFRLLALVDSATFLPRVLVPLMMVNAAEAENLIVQLYAAQLIDVAGPDAEYGQVRYQFHPLVRLYADERLAAAMTEAERADAKGRLADVHLEEIGALVRDQPVQRALCGRVRVEFSNLIETACTAEARGEWHTSWRIAALLGDHMPYDVDPQRCLHAFDRAIHAAEQDSDTGGRVAVAFARGSYLTNIGRYNEGIAALTEAAETGITLGTENPTTPLVVRAYRRIGEAHLQVGAYGEAIDPLKRAHDLSTAQPDAPGRRIELGLVEILQAEARAAIDPAQWLCERPFHEVLVKHNDSDIAYRAHLNLSEVARRQRDWTSALDHLTIARDRHGDDAMRAGSVAYRIARLHLSEARAAHVAGDGPALPAVEEAVSRAVEAVLIFDRVHNPVRAILAQCLLARALVLADQPDEAKAQVHRAEGGLPGIKRAAPAAAELLEAHITRAHAELLLSQGTHRSTVYDHLRRAEQIFANNRDWASQADVLRLLSRACLQLGNQREAIDVLWPAVEDYRRCGELAIMRETLLELAEAYDCC